MKDRSRRFLCSEMVSIATVSLSLLLMVIPSYLSGPGPDTRRPDPVLDIANGIDAPVYEASDSWNYTTEFEVDIMGFPIPFSGWLEMNVVQVILDPFLDMAPVYITNVTGNISGHLYIPFILDLDIYIELKGYTWSKVQDLSLYRTVLNASISGSIPSLNGDYPFGYEFSPPLEEFDFPLVQGDIWWTNVTAALPFGASGDLLSMNRTNSLGALELMTVPAGTFSVLPISIDGKRSLFYNSTVGNTVKRSYELDLDGTVLVIPLELKRYTRHSAMVGLSLKVTSPQPVRAGSTFTVSGRTSISNTVVTVLFPDGNVSTIVPLLLGDRDFDVTLFAPYYPDDTLTRVDHGSFGVLAVVGLLDAIAVATVTTWATDAELDGTSLKISHTGNGSIDDTFTARAFVRNPSNYAVKELRVKMVLDELGLVLLDRSDLTVPAGEVLELSIDFMVDLPGTYNLSLIVDPEDEIPEINESNDQVRKGFQVLERSLLIWTVDPPQGDLQLAEGSWKVLSASAMRDGRSLKGNWTLDGRTISLSDSLNFTTDHTGDRSSRTEPYVLTYALNEGQTFDGEMSSVGWNITVFDVNRPPELLNVTPLSEEIWLSEGAVQYFSVEALDPDDDILDYGWELNGLDLPVHGPAYVLSPDYLGPNSSIGSPFRLVLNVSDGKGHDGTTFMNWTVHVNDTDRPFVRSFDPAPGNLTVAYDVGVTLSFNATDLDGTPVRSTWTYLGRAQFNKTYLSFGPAQLGLSGGETVQVMLEIASGAHMTKVKWNITVLERPPPPQVPPIKGVFIVSPTERQLFLKGENITLKAETNDTRELDYVWMVDGENYRGKEVVLLDLDIGTYTAILRASLPDYPSVRVTLVVNFTVVIEDSPLPGDGPDGRSYLWLLLLLPLIIVTVIPLVLLLVRKKDPVMDWEE